MNPYIIGTKTWDAWEVGYERSLSGAPRHECPFDEIELVTAFQQGWDQQAKELNEIAKGAGDNVISMMDRKKS